MVLLARERFGRPGFIFPSLEEAHLRKPVAGTVALVDIGGVEQLMLNANEQPFEELVPSWAREPMSNLYFPVCLSHDTTRMKFDTITRRITLPLDVKRSMLEEAVRLIIDYCVHIFPEDEPLLGSWERYEREMMAHHRQKLIRQETARKNERRMRLHPLPNPKHTVSQF